jgi:hypothetical protein
MNTYKITFTLNKDQLVSFVDTAGPLLTKATITVIKDEPDVIRAIHRVKVKRGPRGSKVNDAIRSAMKPGPQTVAVLKEALERAGLSAGSLSTGLAVLQKANEVERVGEGVYGLKNQQAEAAE